MPTMTIDSTEPFSQLLTAPSILLASDSPRLGTSMCRILEGSGFPIHYAGDYSQIDALLRDRPFDIVLLEVTGTHAVEAAVEAALRVKRADASQFVGYLADPDLDASGLAGDAVFPRSMSRLPDLLRSFFFENQRD